MFPGFHQYKLSEPAALLIHWKLIEFIDRRKTGSLPLPSPSESVPTLSRELDTLLSKMNFGIPPEPLSANECRTLLYTIDVIDSALTIARDQLEALAIGVHESLGQSRETRVGTSPRKEGVMP